MLLAKLWYWNTSDIVEGSYVESVILQIHHCEVRSKNYWVAIHSGDVHLAAVVLNIFPSVLSECN